MYICLGQLIIILLAVFFIRFNYSFSAFRFLEFRRDYTSLMRGIAILFVVMHHVGNHSGISLFTPLGGIGVSIFLIISGYGINESFKIKGRRNYWSNKVIRVLIPMIIVELAGFFIWDIGKADLCSIIKHFLCIDRNWYVRYLFYWYILFFITSFFEKYQIRLLLFFSLLMLFFFPEIEAEQSASFIVGVLYSKHKEYMHLEKKLVLSGGLLLLGIGLFSLGLKQIHIVRELTGTPFFNLLQLFIKTSIALFVLIWGFVMFKKYVPGFLFFTGIISYEIYLVHCKLLYIPTIERGLGGLLLFYMLTYVLSKLLFELDTRISKIIKVIWQSS